MIHYKSHSADFLRVAFMLVLCLWHNYLSHVQGLYHGYLVVEFFFMLSGFLMYRSFVCHQDQSPLTYTIKRIKRFFPEYVVCLIVCLVIRWLHELPFNFHLYDVTKGVMAPLCDAMMVQSIGVFDSVAGWNNNPMWYLSILIFASSIVYGLLYCSRKWTVNVILPLICLFAYSYIFSRYGKLEVWGVDGFLALPMLRGVADISVGVLTAAAMYCSGNEELKRVFAQRWLFVFAFVLSFCLFFVWKPLDQYSLLAFPVLIASCFTPDNAINKWFRGNVWPKLGALSWRIFLVHYLVLEMMDFYIPHIPNLFVCQVVYVLAVIVAAKLLELATATKFWNTLFHTHS